MTILQVTHHQLGTWDLLSEHDHSTLLTHIYYWLLRSLPMRYSLYLSPSPFESVKWLLRYRKAQ